MLMFKEPDFLNFSNHYGAFNSRFIGYTLEGLMHSYMHISDDFDDDIKTAVLADTKNIPEEADSYYEEMIKEDWYKPVLHS